jgi:SAM-dependent methyltransferase
VRGDDPDVVRAEYATEDGLRARASVYQRIGGEEAQAIALKAVVDSRPRRVLEVGCGWGDFARRVADETGADVVALDLSPRMVELACAQGVDARVGDVQELPFGEGEFDCVVANWMLYHVPDVDRGLGEIARVLRSGGRLVAATSGFEHLGELWALVGRDRSAEPPRFHSENGESRLRRHFARIERLDVEGPVEFGDVDAARGYVASSVAHKHLAERMPDFDGPLVATRRNTIFVAEP